MKKLYTLLAIAFIGFIGNGQIINFTDTNFKARLLAASPTVQIAFNSTTQEPIKIDTNDDGEIQQSEALQVTTLLLDNANISDLTGLEYFTNLSDLSATHNNLTTFNLNGLQITYLVLDNNNLTSVDFSGINSLWQVYLNDNHLSSLSISSPNMIFFQCNNNNLSTIDLSGCTSLTETELYNNQLTSIVFPPFSQQGGILNNSIRLDGNLFETITTPSAWIDYLDCSNNPNLKYLNVKESHGYIFQPVSSYFIFSNCPQLEYICVRDADINDVQAAVANYGYTNCHVNTYCSFTPGGTFYTLEGNNRFDSNGNGCDAADGQIPNMKYIISNGSLNSTLVAGNDGSYHYDLQAGTYTITPVFENPAYFTVTPTSATVNFPATTSPFTQNFCITPNGIHPDLEITVIPLENARPGFNANYGITYKNKGNQPQSGLIGLTYDDAVLDFVSAQPNTTSQSSNHLVWIFSDLNVGETRTIVVTLNLNSPVETPPVNSNDILHYTATISSFNSVFDEVPIDNVSYANQTVVNSLDPNDKTCVEGTTITPSMVGEYVHYVIRFENTGTANAHNVVIKDVIDTSKFDIATLIPQYSSYPFVTKITNTNKVEFIFENINLPFDDDNNDGYVAFKIKTRPNLVLGDTFSNSANIYFDYNAPIVTDQYTTTIAILGNQDFEFNNVFTLSPVPAKDNLTITNRQDLIMSSVNIYNTLGQLILVNTNPSESIDVSTLKTGSYVIKIISDKGTASSKFVKE